MKVCIYYILYFIWKTSCLNCCSKVSYRLFCINHNELINGLLFGKNRKKIYVNTLPPNINLMIWQWNYFLLALDCVTKLYSAALTLSLRGAHTEGLTYCTQDTARMYSTQDIANIRPSNERVTKFMHQFFTLFHLSMNPIESNCKMYKWIIFKYIP